MTPDDAAGPGASTVRASVDNEGLMAEDLAAKSIRAAMAKAAQILDGNTSGVSFSLRYPILQSLFHVETCCNMCSNR